MQSGDMNENGVVSMKINAGCGTDIREGYVNLDFHEVKGMKKDRDIIHDLNKFPYPFKKNSVDEIMCNGTMEHLLDTDKVMGEFHRILKPGGILKISTSHRQSNRAWLNPTQKHVFQTMTFDYYSKGHIQDYRFDFSFKVVKRKLKFGMHQPWNWIVSPIANKFPTAYECTFLRMFPNIEFQVELRKE